jgi:HK97 family phage portal protein
MRDLLANTLARLASWLRPKHIPGALTGSQWSGTSYVDSYRLNRNPTPNELLQELKGAAWACASINAAVCAAYPPNLYVATVDGTQPVPKCLTRALHPANERRLRHSRHLPPRITKAQHIAEVLDHPLLTLLRKVNPVHNAFDLWELTQLYLEVHGKAFWYLRLGPLGIPDEIWPLPAQNVTPRRNPNSTNLVDYYEYRTGAKEQRFAPGEILFFRYPDPRDPYLGGLSPLRACYEQIAIASEYAAFKNAKFQNHALPDALISPEEVIGEEERDRLETQWNRKLKRGGAGKVVIAESGMKVQLLAHSMGDLALLADLKATKEDIANAFHVPLSYLTTNTNLANLQAARTQHMGLAIEPRLQRRDQKLNEQLLPLYDPTGRLFLASEDPVPVDRDAGIAQQTIDLKYGVVTINEVRGERGLPPVPWGDTPWLPLMWAPSDFERWPEDAPNSGRNRRPEMPE